MHKRAVCTKLTVYDINYIWK